MEHNIVHTFWRQSKTFIFWNRCSWAAPSLRLVDTLLLQSDDIIAILISPFLFYIMQKSAIRRGRYSSTSVFSIFYLQILCGYDAIWVKCKDNFVPENVFKAGSSEVRGEDIYIGRAMIEDNLIVGKVHMLYKTCYLPYHGREFETYSYEILVTGNTIVHGVTVNENCLMNPLRALQPCIWYSLNMHCLSPCITTGHVQD